MERRRPRWWTVLKAAVYTIVVPGTVGVLVPVLLVRSGLVDGDPRGWPSFLALLLLGGGALLLAAASKGFAVEGEGTPAPYDPPVRLVVRGPYRYVRNPMYVALAFMILGIARWMRAPGVLVYLAVLLVGFHLFIVFYEEPTLRRVFGAAYEDYLRRVPRWIPRLGRVPSP
jgi:protein-S-isoprenylcysteine O-methyltransferase Ste14